MLARCLSLMCFIWLAVGYTPAIAMSSSSVQTTEETSSDQTVRRVSFHHRATRLHYANLSALAPPLLTPIGEDVRGERERVWPVHFHNRATRLIYSESSEFAPPPVFALPSPIQIKEEVRDVEPFTQIYIEGPFNVQLHTNKRQGSGITVRGDVIDLAHVKTRVKKGVLYVNVREYEKQGRFGGPRLRMGSADLDIHVSKLYSFTYKGQGKITANNIHANPLNLWVANDKTSTWSGSIGLRNLILVGQGHTEITGIHSRDLSIKLIGGPHAKLRGKANLKCLDTRGDGYLSLYWVKGKDIVIRSTGSTRIMLAGVVGRLDAVFSGKTHFNGHYLRAKETFVKTNDEAVAEISTVNDQHTLAHGASDIYYYNLPERRTDFMTHDAATLDMRSEELQKIQSDRVYDH